MPVDRTTIQGLFTPADDPPTVLGRYRLLGPSCGLKVSPLCLGTMNFGNAWQDGMGTCDKATTFEILNTFYDSGGNFVDGANTYQSEESEIWIGEWMKIRGNRDEMVMATKYTTDYTHGTKKQVGSYAGNSYKNMFISVEDSLKKLQTSYIDILYVHWWDYTTPVEELMQGLNQLIRNGKVLYLGVSDTPAWVVAKANMYARSHGLAQFVVYQGRWNAADRDLEAEILPMCRDFGMGIAPWASLGAGKFKTEAQFKELETTGQGRKFGQASEADLKLSKVLEGLAKKHNSIITSVAMAYVLHAYAHTFPIVGGRKVEHLKANIEALKLKLSPEDMKEIEGAYGYSYPFPLTAMFGATAPSTSLNSSDINLLRTALVLDSPSYPHY